MRNRKVLHTNIIVAFIQTTTHDLFLKAQLGSKCFKLTSMSYLNP